MNSFKIGGGLIDSNFEHEQDVNIFLTGNKLKRYWKINKHIYDYHSGRVKEGETDEFMQPLNFFNTLYSQMDIINRFYKRPLRVIEHLRSLKLNDEQRYILLISLYNLQNSFEVHPEEVDEDSDNEISDKLDICFKFVKDEAEVLHQALYGDKKERFAFSFDLIVPLLDSIKLPEEKIKFLMERINFCKQELAQASGDFVDDGSIFVQRCKIEIEHIKCLLSEGILPSAKKELPATKSRAVKPSRWGADLSFEDNFRDFHNGKSNQASKLIAMLQQQAIVDLEGKWIDTDKNIRGLYLAIIENQDKIKLRDYTVHVLYRIFCKKFRIPEDTVPLRSRLNAPMAVKERYSRLINSF